MIEIYSQFQGLGVAGYIETDQLIERGMRTLLGGCPLCHPTKRKHQIRLKLCFFLGNGLFI